MKYATVSLNMPARCPLNVCSGRAASGRTLFTNFTKDKRLAHLVEFISNNSLNQDDIRENLGCYSSNNKFCVTKVGTNSYLAHIVTDVCPLFRMTQESGMFILGEYANGSGTLFIKLAYFEGTDLPGLTKVLEKNLNTTVSIHDLGQRERGSRFTRKQEFLLKQAFDMGYFDYPRKITMGEMSRVMGISKSNFCEILRRALSSLVKMYIDGGGVLPSTRMCSGQTDKKQQTSTYLCRLLKEQEEEGSLSMLSRP